ncbi:MAG: glycosyltransferase family 4 protein [Pseudomonadota bacterium]
MKIAFYAPLKSPDHPVPSGDREIGRNFMAALGLAGHDVGLMSDFRSWDGAGDRRRQRRIRRRGLRIARELTERLLGERPTERPRIWFTYHLYHKAPDWVGPNVAKALRVPYVVAEASHAAKQRNGRWSAGYEAARAGLAQAAAVVQMNRDDYAGVADVVGSERVHAIKPFMDLAKWPVPVSRTPIRERIASLGRISLDSPWLLSVAMMRPGRKVACFALLASALQRLLHLPWRYIVVGDGDAASEVRALFDGPLRDRVHFVGLQTGAALRDYYAAADLFVWPAIGEPLGMTFLEAQALGTAVVAGRTRGVPDMVADGETGDLTPERDVVAFADAVERLLVDTERRTRFRSRARPYVEAEHSLAAASVRLDALMRSLADVRSGP